MTLYILLDCEIQGHTGQPSVPLQANALMQQLLDLLDLLDVLEICFTCILRVIIVNSSVRTSHVFRFFSDCNTYLSRL